VVATNALELGIDIGGLGAAVLAGYPGSIASVYQQGGRAGRGSDPAIAVLIASANPLDQFLVHHPDYFFGQSPERALIDPDHLLILLSHLRCAMFELPFEKNEGFGALPAGRLKEFLDYLVSSQEAHTSNEKYFWMSEDYPAAAISLRSASAENVLLQAAGDRAEIVGRWIFPRFGWSPKIYLHEGSSTSSGGWTWKAHSDTHPVALDYCEPQRAESKL
jgi:DEAD/DEAH box helicase domain-containing protein